MSQLTLKTLYPDLLDFAASPFFHAAHHHLSLLPQSLVAATSPSWSWTIADLSTTSMTLGNFSQISLACQRYPTSTPFELFSSKLIQDHHQWAEGLHRLLRPSLLPILDCRQPHPALSPIIDLSKAWGSPPTIAEPLTGWGSLLMN